MKNENRKKQKSSSPAAKVTTQGNSASAVGDFISKMEFPEETNKMHHIQHALETQSVHDVPAEANRASL